MIAKGFKGTASVFLFLVSCGAVQDYNGNNEVDSIYYPYEKRYEVYQRSVEATTDCTINGSFQTSGVQKQDITTPSSGITPGDQPSGSSTDHTFSAFKLQALVQHIYAAQARVQLEASEIKKAQGVAASSQKALEEATNNVRVVTAALHTAQQEVAASAVRAQAAQLQLAAHDQLLFAARQKVDALSSQMVGLQVEDGVVAPKTVVNIAALLAKLREPLALNQTPTPIPAIVGYTKGTETNSSDSRSENAGFFNYDDCYSEV